MVKAVLFDLGDTLIKSSLSALKTFQQILIMEGIPVSIEEMEKVFTAIKERGDELTQLIGRVPPAEFYKVWNSHVLQLLRIDDDGNLAQKINEKWSTVNELTVFPDVIPVLTRLQDKKIKMGIVSNGYEEEIKEICRDVGLDGFFDVIVGVDTAKVAKPDPGIFYYALQNLGITPEEAVYVGNDVEKDYKGAEKVGMHSLLIVRETKKISEPVTCIENLMELLDFVDFHKDS